MSKRKVKLTEVFTPHFIKVWRKVKLGKFLKHVLKGGRGSAKSTHVAMFIILIMQMFPITFLCVRKVANTLAESCYEQLKEAIEMLDVAEYWDVKKSPLKLTYLPRGNSIIFRGADDPLKIKSIKVSKFPLAGLWIEELAEFKNEDEVSTIEKSVLRGELPEGLRYIFFYTYNPPKRKQNWVNEKYEALTIAKNTMINHSTYLDNPYVSKDFIEEANELKEKSPLKYRWEMLGEAIGSGVVPFDSLKFREITDEEFAAFDNIRQGNDWGYANDPLAFVRWHYDKKKRTIYAMDEVYGTKISNREIAMEIKKRGYQSDMTIADSAEPKSVDEVKLYDVKIKGAKKGPGSIEHGEKWLDDLDEIVIDPKRTPNIAREFKDIDYAVDANGKPKNKLQEENNHTIDATRYAFEDDMKHKGKMKAARAIY
ncbi:PBSX family phage terminase large subunit [Bacillus sp. 1663tsa1]|uniref:PBSX family phage terminase large subunit n=1 Tax=Bacillus sp. 1663tsa1 TaxID=2953804 RepID=UPI00209CBAFC|nr:PBSX family phage terminase large subunit [Bacillus sp. 1663tsa1]MCP1176212.1 PBSX family phage terminase large subunit [Bacillus sp. 1663tsa1]